MNAEDSIGSGYGEWMSVQRDRRQQAKVTKGSSVTSPNQTVARSGGLGCGDQGMTQQQMGKASPDQVGCSKEGAVRGGFEGRNMGGGSS